MARRPVDTRRKGSVPCGGGSARLEKGRLLTAGLEVDLALLPPPGEARDVLLGVRPEDVELRESEGVEALGREEIYAVEPLGAETLVVFFWGDTRVTARAPSSFRARPGETVSFHFVLERALLFDPGSEERLAVELRPTHPRGERRA